MPQVANRRARGYAEIGAASLILGTSAATLQITTMPASLLVVLRMGLAGIVLAVVFFVSGGLDEVRRARCAWRLLCAGVAVAIELLFVFIAIRLTNVTVGVALEYMAPVFLAIVAPWILRTRRRRSDVVAIVFAAAGMALVVIPGLTLSGSHGSLAGVACGLLSAIAFVVAMLLVKSVGPSVRGSTVALFFCLASVLVITPVAAWQLSGGHYVPTWVDVGVVLINGLVFTAFCFSLYTDGLRFVPVEHAGILGYLEPVSAPLWAFLLIGERPPATALIGGALIVSAGVLVVALGRNAGEQPFIEPFA